MTCHRGRCKNPIAAREGSDSESHRLPGALQQEAPAERHSFKRDCTTFTSFTVLSSLNLHVVRWLISPFSLEFASRRLSKRVQVNLHTSASLSSPQSRHAWPATDSRLYIQRLPITGINRIWNPFLQDISYYVVVNWHGNLCILNHWSRSSHWNIRTDKKVSGGQLRQKSWPWSWRWVVLLLFVTLAMSHDQHLNVTAVAVVAATLSMPLSQSHHHHRMHFISLLQPTEQMRANHGFCPLLKRLNSPWQMMTHSTTNTWPFWDHRCLVK